MSYAILQNPDFVFFTTRDFALASKSSISAASRKLNDYANKEIITRITRGLWVNTKHPYFSPLAAVNYLLGNEQGYVSFLTALNLHGLISQIPQTIQVATTGQTRKLHSSIADYEFIKMDPKLMRAGIEWSDTKLPYLIASPEKALLDTLCISTRKSRRFSSLPKLDLQDFNKREFYALLEKCKMDKRIKSAIETKASQIL